MVSEGGWKMVMVALSLSVLASASLPAASSSLPALAPVTTVVSVSGQAGGPLVAHLAVMNPRVDAVMAAPDSIDAVLHAGGRDVPVTLRRMGPPVRVAAKGYAPVDYSVPAPAGAGGHAILSLGQGPDGYAFSMEGADVPARTAMADAPLAEPAAPPSVAPAPPGESIAGSFLGNLSAYGPVRAVTGGGTNTNTRMELGFQYQLLGRAGDPVGSWLDGFRFAYTQRMFWDTAGDSAPFRDVNYQPEFLYFHAWPENGDGDRWSVRGGFLHESNGRGGEASRGYNYLYVQPQLDAPIGAWRISIGPRLYHYVFSRDGNPDIARYRGHQALALSIGREDGLKLSATGRLNLSKGKGAVDADLSYPLTRIWHDLPLYLVVQGFTGYGEDLLDYDRRQSRLRVGIGIVR